MLGCIDITDTLEPNVSVQFCNRSEEASLTDGGSDSLERIRECKGDMKMLLPQLISQLRVRWPEPPAVSRDDEDEEENDQDEDVENEDEESEE